MVDGPKDEDEDTIKIPKIFQDEQNLGITLENFES